MKRKCTLVQGNCDKMVTSAIPPSHDLISENSKNSIDFLSHSQLQYKLCDLTDLLSKRYIAYPLTRRSHSSSTGIYFGDSQSAQPWCFRTGSPNYGPGGKSGPRKHFFNNETIFFTKNLL